jgi:hypothetical protein
MPGELQLISDEDLKAPLELAANYNKLAKEFDDVAKTTAKLVQQIQDQEASMAELNANTKELEKEVKKLEAANKKAAKSSQGMAAATEFADQATGGLVSSTKALAKQLWALVANPFGAMLAALAVTLGAVAAYFKTTAAGGDKLEKIMNSLNGVVVFITNKFAKLGEQIVKMFEGGSIIGKIFSAVFDVIVNRIAGAIDAFTNLLKVINILSKYSLKDIVTGKLSAEDIKELNTAFTDLGKNAVSVLFGVGDAANEAKNAMKALADVTTASQEHGNKVAARILSTAEAQLKIEKLIFISKDKANHTDEQRLAALREAVALSESESQIDKELAIEKERLFAVNLGISKEVFKNQKEANKALAEGLTLEQEKLLATQIDTAQTTELNTLKAASINAEAAFFQEQKKNIVAIGNLEKEIDEAAFQRSEDLRKARIRGVEDHIKALQKSQNKNISSEKGALENYNETIKQKESLDAGFSDRLKETQKTDAKNQKQIADDQAKYIADKKAEEEMTKAALEEAGMQVVADLGNEFFARKQEKLAEELANSEARRDAELKAAGDDERKKLAINRKFDAEQKKIKTKQAQAEKQNALFNIFINTAMGVMKAAPVVPLMIITAALGAIQMALVAAKPIPKFAHGTLSTPENFIAGERGRELVQHNGTSMLVDRPTLFSGLLGAQVFSNAETEGLLGGDVGPALIYGSQLRRQIAYRNRVEETLIDNNRWLKRIAYKDDVGLIVDEEGFHTYSNRVAKRNSRINRRFRGIA